MKKQLIAVAVLAALGMGVAQAQQSPWMVRARAVNLDMANKDGTGLGLTVNNKTIPEFDVSYFINKNVAAELILTVPQKQTVSSKGTVIGTFEHLPPTLLLQYHFTDLGAFKPYVGAGLNYTLISKENILGGKATLDNSSTGGALQFGVDYALDKNWSLNFDVKKIYIKSHVYVGGVNGGSLRLDPVAAGFGIGYRY